MISAPPKEVKESSLPWVEKYRPKNMNEIASQGTVISVLRQSLQSDNVHPPHFLPHLLFYGPPGTGKTSTILALARELFGPTLFRSRILELNASDERGIAVVREKVKNFAKVTVKETIPGYPCPPFKLIILDEADSLTNDAQTALRRTIEQYSRSTRFCLICNYVSRIIDPLTSRCAKFRFGPVEQSAGVERLMMICESEGVQFGQQGKMVMEKVMERCGGDLRRAVTLLQGAHRLAKPLTIDLIDKLAGTIPTELIIQSLDFLSDPSTNPSNLKSFVLETFARSALPPSQYLHQLVPHIMSSAICLPTANQMQKALILEKAAGVEARIGEGSDEIIQILDFFLGVRLILYPTEFKQQLTLL